MLRVTVRRRKMRMNSSKHEKKKPVKNGLVSKLESCLKWEKSKRALAKYQLDQGDVSDEVVKRW